MLPSHARSPGARQLLQLAHNNDWRRCPRCLIFIELVHGCNHMSCICGMQFCYKCGSPWGAITPTSNGRCTRDPPCDIWDEDHLVADAGLEEIPAAFVDVDENPAGFDDIDEIPAAVEDGPAQPYAPVPAMGPPIEVAVIADNYPIAPRFPMGPPLVPAAHVPHGNLVNYNSFNVHNYFLVGNMANPSANAPYANTVPLHPADAQTSGVFKSVYDMRTYEDGAHPAVRICHDHGAALGVAESDI
ncbi:hypothetical protein BD626DRAFT_630022 [Schizophyllum amplum]|uniref:IBR domain-containing protein n=1 Tax=Schizophyllum amplum TaxID=97359 RepID=A0A550CFD6_9AGAR|nr:hypothetical protein BD626DRAFT_630022 [Auriculariopsis ampla]